MQQTNPRNGKFNDTPNHRAELIGKCPTNIRIKNLLENMTEGTTDFFVFHGKIVDRPESPIGYLSHISVDGLTINHNKKTVKSLMPSNIEIGTKTPVDCQIKKRDVEPAADKVAAGV